MLLVPRKNELKLLRIPLLLDGELIGYPLLLEPAADDTLAAG